MLIDDLDFDVEDEGYDIIDYMVMADEVRTSDEPSSGNVGCVACLGFFLLVGVLLTCRRKSRYATRTEAYQLEPTTGR